MKLKQNKILNKSDLIDLDEGTDVTKFKDGGDGEVESIDRLFSKRFYDMSVL